jgi:hypothetical protein
MSLRLEAGVVLVQSTKLNTGWVEITPWRIFRGINHFLAESEYRRGNPISARFPVRGASAAGASSRRTQSRRGRHSAGSCSILDHRGQRTSNRRDSALTVPNTGRYSDASATSGGFPSNCIRKHVELLSVALLAVSGSAEAFDFSTECGARDLVSFPVKFMERELPDINWTCELGTLHTALFPHVHALGKDN